MFIAESQYREKVESMTEKKDWISILNEASVVRFRAKIEIFALYRNINFYKCKRKSVDFEGFVVGVWETINH